MSKLYPIKVLLDANKKPFIPFITSNAVVVDGTEYTVQDLLDMRYTKEEVDAIIQSLGTLQRLRGRVDTYEDLLLIEGQQAGDTYIVGASDTENSEYMWIGEKWEKLGPLVDLTDYYNKADIDALFASAEANIAGAIAQGDNETLNLAKNYAEDKIAEAMSGVSTTGPIIIPLLLKSTAPMVTQSGTIATFLNEKVAPVLKAVGPENVIVMINSTGMITEQYHGMFMYNADLTQLRKIDRTEQVSIRADESGSYTNSISVVSYINIVYTDIDNYVVSSVSFSTADDVYSEVGFLSTTKTYSTPFIPTDPGHPVSKQYVDDLILGAEAALDEIIEGV